INRDCAWEEVYGALEVLRQQGKIIYAGASNFAGWHLTAAVLEARRLGILGMASEQSKYSLDCRYIELEVLPACRQYGMGVIPWSPLDGGLLGGVLGGEKGLRRESEGARKKIDARREQLRKWENLCKELGERPADVALAWLLHVPGVTAPIIGPRTVEQLDQSLRALEIKLSAESMAALDQIWPPVGVADLQAQSQSPFR